jgi:CDP-diacylglycerol--serine O-phosphatidyltransferase
VKYITLLPSLITLLNGVCGFTAIVFASKGAASGMGEVTYFEMAAYMILFAMLADMLDGRLARMSQSTSSFGGQLDSLCDLVSFGVAPAFLMLTMLDHILGPTSINSVGLMSLPHGPFQHRFIWLAAVVYMSCAAIRLARFNVENESDEDSHISFAGLPSPAAAGVIASLIIFYQQEAPDFAELIYALPFICIAVGVLMVSRIRYPHVLNQYLRGKKPFAHFIKAILFLGLVLWRMQTALALIFCGFAVSGFLKWLYYKVLRKRSYPASATELTDLAGQGHTDITRID